MTNYGSPAPLYWRQTEKNPAPLAWLVLFEELTQGESAKQWGLAAGLYIIHHHRRYSKGPTFREVFEHLFPETGGLPSRTAEEWSRDEWFLARSSFRVAVIVAWGRLRYVSYDLKVPNSLRVGPRLLALVRRDERIRSLAGEPAAAELRSTQRAATQSSLTSEQARVRLRTTRRVLARLTRAGYVHAVELPSNTVRYPIWQFSPEAHRPVVVGVSTIVSSIPTDWTLARIHRFFTTPHPHLLMGHLRLTPTQWLNQNGDAMEVAILLEGYSYDID